MLLRPFTPADGAAVLALNAASVTHLSPLDPDRLDRLLGWSYRLDVLVEGGAVVGFVVLVAPDSGYDSVNYRWFAQRFPSFLYLDRIVVAEGHRRRGYAGQVYDEMEAAAAGYGRLVCEVDVVPPNPASLAFHAGRGFREVGRLDLAGGKKVAMLDKPLPT